MKTVKITLLTSLVAITKKIRVIRS